MIRYRICERGHVIVLQYLSDEDRWDLCPWCEWADVGIESLDGTLEPVDN